MVSLSMADFAKLKKRKEEEERAAREAEASAKARLEARKKSESESVAASELAKSGKSGFLPYLKEQVKGDFSTIGSGLAKGIDKAGDFFAGWEASKYREGIEEYETAEAAKANPFAVMQAKKNISEGGFDSAVQDVGTQFESRIPFYNDKTNQRVREAARRELEKESAVGTEKAEASRSLAGKAGVAADATRLATELPLYVAAPEMIGARLPSLSARGSALAGELGSAGIVGSGYRGTDEYGLGSFALDVGAAGLASRGAKAVEKMTELQPERIASKFNKETSAARRTFDESLEVFGENNGVTPSVFDGLGHAVDPKDLKIYKANGWKTYTKAEVDAKMKEPIPEDMTSIETSSKKGPGVGADARKLAEDIRKEMGEDVSPKMAATRAFEQTKDRGNAIKAVKEMFPGNKNAASEAADAIDAYREPELLALLNSRKHVNKADEEAIKLFKSELPADKVNYTEVHYQPFGEALVAYERGGKKLHAPLWQVRAAGVNVDDLPKKFYLTEKPTNNMMRFQLKSELGEDAVNLIEDGALDVATSAMRVANNKTIKAVGKVVDEAPSEELMAVQRDVTDFIRNRTAAGQRTSAEDAYRFVFAEDGLNAKHSLGMTPTKLVRESVKNSRELDEEFAALAKAKNLRSEAKLRMTVEDERMAFDATGVASGEVKPNEAFREYRTKASEMGIDVTKVDPKDKASVAKMIDDVRDASNGGSLASSTAKTVQREAIESVKKNAPVISTRQQLRASLNAIQQEVIRGSEGLRRAATARIRAIEERFKNDTAQRLSGSKQQQEIALAKKDETISGLKQSGKENVANAIKETKEEAAQRYNAAIAKKNAQLAEAKEDLARGLHDLRVKNAVAVSKLKDASQLAKVNRGLLYTAIGSTNEALSLPKAARDKLLAKLYKADVSTNDKLAEAVGRASEDLQKIAFKAHSERADAALRKLKEFAPDETLGYVDQLQDSASAMYRSTGDAAVVRDLADELEALAQVDHKRRAAMKLENKSERGELGVEAATDAAKYSTKDGGNTLMSRLDDDQIKNLDGWERASRFIKSGAKKVVDFFSPLVHNQIETKLALDFGEDSFIHKFFRDKVLATTDEFNEAKDVWTTKFASAMEDMTEAEQRAFSNAMLARRGKAMSQKDGDSMESFFNKFDSTDNYWLKDGKAVDVGDVSILKDKYGADFNAAAEANGWKRMTSSDFYKQADILNNPKFANAAKVWDDYTEANLEKINDALAYSDKPPIRSKGEYWPVQWSSYQRPEQALDDASAFGDYMGSSFSRSLTDYAGKTVEVDPLKVMSTHMDNALQYAFFRKVNGEAKGISDRISGIATVDYADAVEKGVPRWMFQGEPKMSEETGRLTIKLSADKRLKDAWGMVNDSARNMRNAEKVTDKAANIAGGLGYVAALGLRATTGVLQTLSFAPGAMMLGSKNVLWGIGNVKKYWKQAHELSHPLRSRSGGADNVLYRGPSKAIANVQKALTANITYPDMAVATANWLGAAKKSMDMRGVKFAGKFDEESVKYANLMMERIMGTNEAAKITPEIRTPLGKTLTFMQKTLFNQYSQFYREFKNATPARKAKIAGYFAATAGAEQLIRESMAQITESLGVSGTGESDRAKKLDKALQEFDRGHGAEFVKYILERSFKGTLGMVPFANQFAKDDSRGLDVGTAIDAITSNMNAAMTAAKYASEGDMEGALVSAGRTLGRDVFRGGEAMANAWEGNDGNRIDDAKSRQIIRDTAKKSGEKPSKQEVADALKLRRIAETEKEFADKLVGDYAAGTLSESSLLDALKSMDTDEESVKKADKLYDKAIASKAAEDYRKDNPKRYTEIAVGSMPVEVSGKAFVDAGKDEGYVLKSLDDAIESGKVTEKEADKIYDWYMTYSE